MRRLPRRLLLWGGALALAATGFVFMATNTVDASNAGEGVGVVSGYHVYDLSYSGVNDVGNPGHNVGTMKYLGGGVVVNGISQQDGVTTVSFRLDPDNATWAAVQLYDSSKGLIGGGGASNCSESGGVWTCVVTSTEGHNSVPANEIRYVDVEASQ